MARIALSARRLAAFLTAAHLVGCASIAPPPEALPADFAVEVAVQPPQPSAPQAEAMLRSAVYLVQPGGEFAAAVGSDDPTTTRPAPMRFLDSEQTAQLWSLLRDSGFDPAGAEQSVAAGGRPHSGKDEARIMAAIWVRANGSARWWYLPLTGEAANEGARRVAHVCAALAWQSDGVAPTTRPPRFDFGPDPYASFRPTASAGGKSSDGR